MSTLASPPPNVFLYYHEHLHQEEAFENLLTEVTAFFLSCDQEALAAVCRLILGTDFEAPLSIATQWHGNHGTPDMVIRLTSQKRLILENKTKSPLHDRQLENYLDDLGP